MKSNDTPVSVEHSASAETGSQANHDADRQEPGTLVGVTFHAAALGAQRAVIVGDFNEWSTDATPMELVGELFEVTVPLERGKCYRYKFLLDGDRWENDPHADDYVPNEYGGHDSVRGI